jgi:hypothetical protein
MNHSQEVTPMIAPIRSILLRDLDHLVTELEAFDSDAHLWQALPGTSNPPGALAMHICGNLQHFIGANLGRTGYVRDRSAEFAARDLPRRAVLDEVARTRTIVDDILSGLDDGAPEREYPVPFLDEASTTGAVLFHLSGHLMYHLGQINYARRYHIHTTAD